MVIFSVIRFHYIISVLLVFFMGCTLIYDSKLQFIFVNFSVYYFEYYFTLFYFYVNNNNIYNIKY